jgi:enoyl-CoA hydratase/carnithine racemase
MTTDTQSSAGHSIRFDIDGAVATIAIDRPDEMNRFRPEDLVRLGEIVDALRDARDVHAVIVTGAGEVFSFGLLNPEIRASLPKEGVLDIVFLANRVFDALEALPQIVVAAINGPLMAGAVELALACDIRVAADNTTMMLPEAKWGGFPGAGGPVRLPLVVGYGKALELVATGAQIDAAEMARIGFLEHVWPVGELRERAQAMAQTIAANGPLATRGAKRIARARREPGFRAARELADALRQALEYSADVDEGMAAHRENRAPKFTGR